MKEKKKKQKSEKTKEEEVKVVEIEKEEEIEIKDEPIEEKVVEDKTEEYEFYRPTISSETYVETVDSLVKEVQLFHEEGEIEASKKSKFGLMLGIVLFIIVIGIIVFLLVNNENDASDNDNKNNNNKEETYNYEYKELEDRIEFYDGESLIDTYTCMNNKCSVYSLGMYNYFSTNPAIVAIIDDENIFLYDYIDKKTVSAFYNTMQNLYKDNQTVAFIVSNSDKLYGVIDITGKVIVPLEYDAIAYSIGGGVVSDYSYENNLITISQDGLWGMLSLENNDIILDIKYEDIYYNEYNKIVVKEDGLWYLIDHSGEKIFEEGYDIIIPTKSYMFVSVDGIFNILNYKGNNIINADIPTYIKEFRKRNQSVVPTFKIEVDGTIININIMKSEVEFIEYKFNTVNGELTEVIK